MTSVIKKILIGLSGNQPAQRVLERCVIAAQYLMGIGSGGLPGSSGEHVLAARLKDVYAGSREPLCVFDVGANKGQFVSLMTSLLAGMPHRVHSFEPGNTTFRALQAQHADSPNVILNNVALGATTGNQTLYSDKDASELASLYKRRLDHFGVTLERGEQVWIETVDDYCERKGVSRIDLLKLDVEGHELAVLQGAAGMLSGRRVSMVSFEFGGTQIDSRTFFQDIYYFCRENGLDRIFRIAPSGCLVPMSEYKEIYEQFRTTNFLALASEQSPRSASSPQGAQQAT